MSRHPEDAFFNLRENIETSTLSLMERVRAGRNFFAMSVAR